MVNMVKYVTDTEIKWSIISTSLMIIIFVEFINKLIDNSINCASLIIQYNFVSLLFLH